MEDFYFFFNFIIFAGYSSLGWQLFSFRASNILFYALLTFRVSVEKCAGLTFSFSLVAFNIISLFSVLNV
jgi:hypothetical protein